MQAGWMVLGAFLFATMGVCIKMGSAYFNPAELVFWRGIIGVVVLGGLAYTRRVPLATRYTAMHAWRSFIGVISLGAWFYAIAHLPLATAVTLNYMSSIWVAAFLVGGALMAWRPGASDSPSPRAQVPLFLTVLAGFAGVLLLLRPSINPQQGFAAVVGLLSGITAAFAYMQVMALSRVGEPETRTVFYFALGATVAGAAAMLITGTSAWSWRGALWLPPLGILAAFGQLCITRAYATANTHHATLLVANLQYSGIIFAAMYGMLLFGDHITALGWAGMALIIASGIAATALRKSAAPESPVEEH
jgi:drug/metabolite transporter (DMT)-like permease